MVEVDAREHGLRVVEPLPLLYQQYQLTVTNGQVHVTPDTTFRIMVANLGKTPQYLEKKEVIGSLTPHPLAMLCTKLTVADFLRVVTHDESLEGEAAQNDGEEKLLQADKMEGPNNWDMARGTGEGGPTGYDKVDRLKDLQ